MLSNDSPDREGLPLQDPDEFERGLDNIIPTRGYSMLPMVGLGGSAGSIPAMLAFFEKMPVDSGMVFVVVLHLLPDHESTLATLLQRATTMPVVQAKNSVKVAPNHVYVIPPGKHIATTDGHLRLTPLEPEYGKRVAVDLFFRTLADTHGPNSAAIVLSGADGDGATGIKRIKERGGLTIAQDPDEAEHSSMPRAAIGTGMVDWVLPVGEMPARLIEYHARGQRLHLPPEEGPQPVESGVPIQKDEAEVALRDILIFLRTRTGRDFSYYKRATILRRISRRMQVNSLDDLPAYLAFLRTNPGEAGALLQDLLISVTNFFRDREAFEALERMIPSLFLDKGPSDTVRVWVSACATGEEAYSIAMLLWEYSRTLEAPPLLQVFATDLDEVVIQTARQGLYPGTIATDVNEDRLRRFFVPDHRGYRIRREVREIVLFALHDLLKDSPFSRIDLVSCRNLLIYLNREAQRRAFEIFHFSLNPSGYLFLGSSESVGDGSSLFTTSDKKHRIYAPRVAARVPLPVPVGPSTLLRAMEAQEKAGNGPFLPDSLRHPETDPAKSQLFPSPPEIFDKDSASWGKLHFKLLEHLAAPSILVNEEQDIVHLSPKAGRFLQFSAGKVTRNLLQAVHPMLRIELRAAMYRASQSGGPVRAFRVPIETDGKRSDIDLSVQPAGEIGANYFVIVFDEYPADGKGQIEHKNSDADAANQLELELEHTKNSLRVVVEQFEASTEELKASNEELQAMNEELRSATEELETSREELQSINEELTTVNQELKSKVEDLGQSNSDLHNLMGATAIATVFLDRELRITRFTPPAVDLFNFLLTDIGRPLTNLTPQLYYPELHADATHVLKTLIPIEREVRDPKDRRYLARIRPYRTIQDHIAGVVLTFVEVTALKRAEEALRRSEARYRAIIEQATAGVCETDFEGNITFANPRFVEIIGRPLEELLKLRIQDFIHSEDLPRHAELFAKSVASGSPFEIEERCAKPDGAIAWLNTSSITAARWGGQCSGHACPDLGRNLTQGR